MAFAGLRVISFESRRSSEIAQLIRNQDGVPFVAPAARETAEPRNPGLSEFVERLFRSEFDMGIFFTGIGTRALHKVVLEHHPDPAFADALRAMSIAARGPKPIAVLRELGVPVTVTAPEPNTWRELLAALEGRPEKRIFVQEYGASNTEFLDCLRDRGADVTPVHVYRWELPVDSGPLREAVRRIAASETDVILFTTSIQLIHLLRIADEMGQETPLRHGLRKLVIASIGPTTTKTLREHGIEPDVEPSHSKMGFLVKETADLAAVLLDRKRAHEAGH